MKKFRNWLNSEFDISDKREEQRIMKKYSNWYNESKSNDYSDWVAFVMKG